MTPHDAIKFLRDLGYAVVVFRPEELRGMDRTRLEDSLNVRGDILIEAAATERDPRQLNYVAEFRAIIVRAYEVSPNDYPGFVVTLLNATEKLNELDTYELPDVVGDVLTYLNDAEGVHTPTVASEAAKQMLDDWKNYDGDYRD